MTVDKHNNLCHMAWTVKILVQCPLPQHHHCSMHMYPSIDVGIYLYINRLENKKNRTYNDTLMGLVHRAKGKQLWNFIFLRQKTIFPWYHNSHWPCLKCNKRVLAFYMTACLYCNIYRFIKLLDLLLSSCKLLCQIKWTCQWGKQVWLLHVVSYNL